MNLEEIRRIEKDNKYKKKILGIKYESLPFLDFQNTRYSMTVKVNIGQVYNYAKSNKIPFFNLTSYYQQ